MEVGKIETGIEITEATVVGISKFDWMDMMEVGDSRLLTGMDEEGKERKRVVAAARSRKKAKGWEYKIRKQANGDLRIWRDK